MTRPELPAMVLAVPILAAACLVVAAPAAERGGWAWWNDTRPRNAAEAAALGRPAELVRLLRRGDHPEQVFAVRAELIRESPAWLSAIEGALWADGPATIRLLEREGAIVTADARARLACLALDVGQPATADYLMAAGRACVPGAALAAIRARTGP